MIHNRSTRPQRKAASVRCTLYTPVPGASFSHHPYITHFRDRFYAMWSCGFCNEDDCGQYIRLTRSDDGEHWEESRPVITPAALGDPEMVLTAAGFYATEDRLILYFGAFRYREDTITHEPERPIGIRPFADAAHIGTALYAITTEDGEHWSEPRAIGVRLVPNHSPFTTSGGRLIIPGNVMFPYSDDPSGLGPFTPTGIYGDCFGDETPYDDSESIHLVTKTMGWQANLICEGSVYETDDHRLRMLLRSNSETLWCTESTDDGTTWSAPYRTEFTNCGSKFKCGRLPDGRFFCVGNPEPGPRLPLSVSLSEDGEAFDTTYILRDEPREMIYPGFAKGGVYGYPDAMVWNGELIAIYSVQKEGVEITRVPLSELK